MASVVHAEVALTSALPLQIELTKVTTNQGVFRYPYYKNINRLNSSNISNEGRQINRGDYTCSSSVSGNVAGSSLGGVAVEGGVF